MADETNINMAKLALESAEQRLSDAEDVLRGIRWGDPSRSAAIRVYEETQQALIVARENFYNTIQEPTRTSTLMDATRDEVEGVHTS